MKIDIKSRFSGAVLFSHECDGNTLRITAEAAVKLRADLGRANLVGADLGGADLGGAKLVGRTPILQLGPIGSRSDYLVAFNTDAGIKIVAGCFRGSRDEFEVRVADTHGDNQHGREYAAALAMIDAWATIRAGESA